MTPEFKVHELATLGFLLLLLGILDKKLTMQAMYMISEILIYKANLDKSDNLYNYKNKIT